MTETRDRIVLLSIQPSWEGEEALDVTSMSPGFLRHLFSRQDVGIPISIISGSAVMSGYRIEQLLEWTLQDHLIDGYVVEPDGRVEISRGDQTIVLKHQRAEKMLCDLIRSINRELPAD